MKKVFYTIALTFISAPLLAASVPLSERSLFWFQLRLQDINEQIQNETEILTAAKRTRMTSYILVVASMTPLVVYISAPIAQGALSSAKLVELTSQIRAAVNFNSNLKGAAGLMLAVQGADTSYDKLKKFVIPKYEALAEYEVVRATQARIRPFEDELKTHKLGWDDLEHQEAELRLILQDLYPDNTIKFRLTNGGTLGGNAVYYSMSRLLVLNTLKTIYMNMLDIATEEGRPDRLQLLRTQPKVKAAMRSSACKLRLSI